MTRWAPIVRERIVGGRIVGGRIVGGRRSRWWVPLFAALSALALACQGGQALPGTSRSPGPPGTGLASMAALGDSMTEAFGSCLAPTPCPRNSWSTGDGTQVNSHYRRLLKANSALKGNGHNLAVDNVRADALAGQARSAVSTHAGYVTVLIGANDACRDRIEDMTPVEQFRTQVDQALAVLKQGLPQARVLVVSLPDIHRLWEVGHTSQPALKAWSYGICPALLANPTSTAPADTARRTAFDERVKAYDTQLVAACKAYGPRCRDDGGAAHRVAYSLNLISALDFFHPDAAGQSALAAATYPGQPTW